VVFGYQFNLFYPDLEDVTKTPTFKIHRTEDQDLVIIEFIAGNTFYCVVYSFRFRFHSIGIGPPYRSIAFKIRAGDWEKLPRSGYKSLFSQGVMQLWFNFKRYRYRR